MKVVESLPQSSLPGGLTQPRKPVEKPVPEAVPLAREDDPVDVRFLVHQCAAIEQEIESMQEARDSLKARLTASEQAVTACLREYSSNSNDMALKKVDEAKEDEAQCRKRVHTNNDSLTIRKKDLAELREQYDEGMKGIISQSRAALLVERKKKQPGLLKRIRTPLIDVIATMHLEGLPHTMIDLDTMLKKQLPGLYDDVEDRVQELLKGLEDG